MQRNTIKNQLFCHCETDPLDDAPIGNSLILKSSEKPCATHAKHVGNFLPMPGGDGYSPSLSQGECESRQQYDNIAEPEGDQHEPVSHDYAAPMNE